MEGKDRKVWAPNKKGIIFYRGQFTLLLRFYIVIVVMVIVCHNPWYCRKSKSNVTGSKHSSMVADHVSKPCLLLTKHKKSQFQTKPPGCHVLYNILIS